MNNELGLNKSLYFVCGGLLNEHTNTQKFSYFHHAHFALRRIYTKTFHMIVRSQRPKCILSLPVEQRCRWNDFKNRTSKICNIRQYFQHFHRKLTKHKAFLPMSVFSPIWLLLQQKLFSMLFGRNENTVSDSSFTTSIKRKQNIAMIRITIIIIFI